MVIALGVTLATGGATGLAMKAGTSLATTLGAQGTTASIITAMGAAGFTALCSQAAVQLVASKGNIFEAAKNLTTAETLTNLAVAMATAGVLEGMSQQLGMGSTLPPAKEAATSGLKEGVKQAATQPASGTAAASFFQSTLTKGMDFLKREALKGAVGASVNAAFGQRVLAGDVLKTIGMSVLADVLASTGGDLHAEGAITDAGQTAWHMGSGAVVGGLMGGSEGAIAAAGANLIADLAFKGLAPTKPPSLDPDEQKAYSDAIDRTAIAAKLLAPITIMFVTGGSAAATSAAIGTSSAMINENHMAHLKFLTEEEQQIVDDAAVEYAEELLGEELRELGRRHGDLVDDFYQQNHGLIHLVGEAIPGVGHSMMFARHEQEIAAGRMTRGEANVEALLSLIPGQKVLGAAYKGTRFATKASQVASKAAMKEGLGLMREGGAGSSTAKRPVTQGNSGEAGASSSAATKTSAGGSTSAAGPSRLTPVENIRKVSREQRWLDLATESNSRLPKEVIDHVQRHRGKGIQRRFGLELAHRPKQAASQGFDYSNTIPKTTADHRGLQHRYLKERTDGTTISKPKTDKSKNQYSLPKEGKLP